MDLNHLHINSPNVDLSVGFYQRYFGFNEIKARRGGSYFLFNNKGFMMAICPMERAYEMPEWFHYGFRLNSLEEVEQLYARMQADGCTICAPLEKYDDFVFFRCREPAGYEIEVYWEPQPAV